MSRLLIQLSHVSTSFGPNSLFQDLFLSINQGDCLALIGENGSGKTSLLRIIEGTLVPEEGRVERLSSVTLRLLPQEVVVSHPSISVRAYIEEGRLLELEREMEFCLGENQLTEWERLHEEYERCGGYRRLPLETVLHGLQLEALFDMPMAHLSSGQRVRVALAKALIANPDLLLLDEPTNHLDHSMLEWLKDVIRQRTGATMLVSHDRRFLNETCTRLIEIDKGALTCYGGSYDWYLQEKERLVRRQIQAYEEQKEEKVALQQKIKSISFSRAKPRPPSDRNIMAYDKHGESHQKSLQRTLDRLKDRLEELEAAPLHHPKPKSIKGLFFPSMPLLTEVALEFEGMSKSFGNRCLFSGLSRTLKRGDRIHLKGPNGCGKTTFLRCALGEVAVDSGVIVRGAGVRVAYLDQEVARLPMEETPACYFEKNFHLSLTDLRSELHKAALGGDSLLDRSFSTMSVGQRKRLMLLSLVLEKPNVLLLDEPTNHLDFRTLEALETALVQFDGAVLFVSHDRTFIQKIASDHWEIG